MLYKYITTLDATDSLIHYSFFGKPAEKAKTSEWNNNANTLFISSYCTSFVFCLLLQSWISLWFYEVYDYRYLRVWRENIKQELTFWLYICSRRKVEHVAEEADSLKDSLDKYFQRHQRRMQETQERDALLGRAVCGSLFFKFILCMLFFFCISLHLTSNTFIEWGIVTCFENLWWGSSSNAVCSQFFKDAGRS